MKFHQLLQNRDTLLHQTRLANLAFAHDRLTAVGARIARARLHGAVTLSLADPAEGRAWPVLLSFATSPAVIEEHFTDADIAELADILTFLHEGAGTTEFHFRLEELAGRYLPGLQRELAQAGVAPAPAPTPPNHAR